jgi:hypothetical protein
MAELNDSGAATLNEHNVCLHSVNGKPFKSAKSIHHCMTLPLQGLSATAALEPAASEPIESAEELRSKARKARRARISSNQRELALLRALPSDQVPAYLQ